MPDKISVLLVDDHHLVRRGFRRILEDDPDIVAVAEAGDGNEATLSDKVHFLGRDFVNTSLYNYSLAVAFLIVAIISPLLSSIADFRGNKKKFMNFFLTMGSLACAGMYFFDKTTLGLGVLCMILGCVGFWASLVYYNSFLPEIAAPEDRDRVSNKIKAVSRFAKWQADR